MVPARMVAASIALLAPISLALLPPAAAAVSVLLGVAMVAIAAVDLREYRIPDVLSLPAIPIGLLASGRLVDGQADLVAISHVLGAGAGGLAFFAVREAYFRLRGREGLGLGDVKLAAVAGAWTGWQGLTHVVLLAAVAALAWVVAGRLRARTGTGAAEPGAVAPDALIPFGVTLAPAIWVVWMLQRLALLD